MEYQEFITESEMKALPRRAKLSFAVHSARAVQPLVLAHIPYEDRNVEVETALVSAERAAAAQDSSPDRFGLRAMGLQWIDGQQWAGEAADSFHTSAVQKCAAWAVQAAYTAALFVCSPSDRDEGRRWDEDYYAYNAVCDAIRAASVSEKSRESFGNALKEDLEVLVGAVRANSWTDETPVPVHFYQARSQFDTAGLIDEPTIIEVASLIDRRLIEIFRRHPERMYHLEPRQFEELIAEVFDGFGFRVTLTRPTRDGGKDIVAVEPNTNQRLLIECKRYRDRPVGLAAVQRLLGVTIDEEATKGILVTTSRFSRSALACLQRNEWILEGRDFDGLLKWLNEYQRLKWANILDVSKDLARLGRLSLR